MRVLEDYSRDNNPHPQIPKIRREDLQGVETLEKDLGCGFGVYVGGKVLGNDKS